MRWERNEVSFDRDEFIVSKTDLKGRITYVNRTFMTVSGFAEDELLGQPHSVIRHDDMPRAVFKLLWDHLLDGREIFAYVKNRCKDERFYWVFAHVTPSRDARGRVVGYHSVRRLPDRQVLEDIVKPLYASLRRTERSEHDRRTGLNRSFGELTTMLTTTGVEYDEWIFSL